MSSQIPTEGMPLEEVKEYFMMEWKCIKLSQFKDKQRPSKPVEMDAME